MTKPIWPVGRMSSHEHLPVLLEETTAYLDPRAGGRFVDATVGRGGHARRILEMTAPNGQLLGIDVDRQSIDSALVSLQVFAGRVTLVNAYFDNLDAVARDRGFDQVDGVLFDLGVSSPQLEDPLRGFSFQHPGPLDMRMGPAAERTAGEIVATAGADELERIFREYGEERYSRRIARRIVAERDREKIETTNQLAHLVVKTVPVAYGRIHPATRVFQALRIAVNDELRRLEVALPRALSLLREGGRLVVISFHSLEDRIVKQFMRSGAQGCICAPGTPACICGRSPTLRTLTRRPVIASQIERRFNRRSRGAKLRAAEAI